MDHLAEAKEQVEQAGYTEDVTEATYWVHLAIAHAAIVLAETMDRATNALIAIAERLPPPAETASECSKRLREEEQNGV